VNSAGLVVGGAVLLVVGGAVLLVVGIVLVVVVVVLGMTALGTIVIRSTDRVRQQPHGVYGLYEILTVCEPL